MRRTIQDWHLPVVTDVRGRGLMIGTEIIPEIKPFDIEKACMDEGLCVSIAGSHTIRFLPPLTISDDEISRGLDIFRRVLETF